MIKKSILLILLFASGIIFSGNIWYWTDDEGVRHYSNVKPPQGVSFEELEESRQIQKKLNSSQGKGYLFHVTRVFDGDTVQVVGLDLKLTVRLVGIDSPEIGFDGRPSQPYSQKAKQVLADWVEDKKVTLKSYGTGGYGRQLAEIFLGGENINLKMVEAGLAQVYTGRRPKALNSDLYLSAEAVAKSKKKGMWRQGGSYKSPRQWRREHPRK
jgi:micrococcal nuclease